MRRIRRTFRLATAMAVLLVTALSTGAVAEPEPVVTVQDEQRIAAAEIAAAARSRGQGRGTDAAIGQHISEQARDGRLLDAKNVFAAEVGGGFATWEKGASITELRSARAESTDVREGSDATSGGIVELAMLSDEDPNTKGSNPAAVAGAGMGYASYQGGTRLSNTCQTWKYSEQSLTGCYQKFKPTRDGSSTRDYYAYNRYATATGKDALQDWVPVKIDIRSRPRAGSATRTKGMSGYFPNTGTQLCNEGGSVGITLESLSLTIPLRDCKDKNPIPDATSKTMGIIYDQGFVFSGPRSQGADFEMEVFAWQGGAVPLLGDYNYAKFCQWTLSGCPAVIGKDGW